MALIFLIAFNLPALFLLLYIVSTSSMDKYVILSGGVFAVAVFLVRAVALMKLRSLDQKFFVDQSSIITGEAENRKVFDWENLADISGVLSAPRRPIVRTVEYVRELLFFAGPVYLHFSGGKVLRISMVGIPSHYYQDILWPIAMKGPSDNLLLRRLRENVDFQQGDFRMNRVRWFAYFSIIPVFFFCGAVVLVFQEKAVRDALMVPSLAGGVLSLIFTLIIAFLGGDKDKG